MEALFAASRAGEAAVRQLISDVLDGVFQTIDKAYIESIDIDIAANFAMFRLKRLEAWANYQHDGNMPPVVNREDDETSAMELLLPDDEPRPAPIDPWARGVVQVKKVSSHEATLFKTGTRIVSPSASSYRSSVYGKSSRRSSTTMSSKRSTSSSKDSAGVIIELENKYELGNIHETGYMYDMLAKAVRSNLIIRLSHVNYYLIEKARQAGRKEGGADRRRGGESTFRENESLQTYRSDCRHRRPPRVDGASETGGASPVHDSHNVHHFNLFSRAD